MPHVGSNRLNPRDTRDLGHLYPSLETLGAAAEAARALIAHPGWNVLQELVDAEVATIDRELDSGKPLDSRADYAAKHGRRGGLRGPLEKVQALIATADAEFERQRAKHEGAVEPAPIGVRA